MLPSLDALPRFEHKWLVLELMRYRRAIPVRCYAHLRSSEPEDHRDAGYNAHADEGCHQHAQGASTCIGFVNMSQSFQAVEPHCISFLAGFFSTLELLSPTAKRLIGSTRGRLSLRVHAAAGGQIGDQPALLRDQSQQTDRDQLLGRPRARTAQCGC
jgi:hypothetical protein